MLDIYDCTGLSGTNHVSRVYNDAAFLGLKYDAISHDKHFDLDINTFRRMFAVHNTAVYVVS